MRYVSQIIMLCTLNLHSAICQLYLNTTGRKKKKKASQIEHLQVFLSRRSLWWALWRKYGLSKLILACILVLLPVRSVLTCQWDGTSRKMKKKYAALYLRWLQKLQSNIYSVWHNNGKNRYEVKFVESWVDHRLKKNVGVPIMAQWQWTQRVSMRTWVWSLAWLIGLRIWSCCELWWSLQTQLGSRIAVAVV